MSLDFYIWRDNVVTSLLSLCDRRYQRLAWSGTIATSEGAPYEILNHLYEEGLLEEFAIDHRSMLTERQISLLHDLCPLILRFYKQHGDWLGEEHNTVAVQDWEILAAKGRELYHALCPE